MKDKHEDSKGGPDVTRRGLLSLLGAGAASAAGNVPAVDALTKLASSSGTISNFFGVPDMLRMGSLLSQVTDICTNPKGVKFLRLIDPRLVLSGTLDHGAIDQEFAQYISSIQPVMEKQYAYETFMRDAVKKAMESDHFISELLPEERVGLNALVRELSEDHPAFKPDQIQRLGAFLLRMVKAQGGKGLDSGLFTLFEGQSSQTFMENSLRNALDNVLEDQVLPVPSPAQMFRSIVLDNAEHMQGIGHPISRELFQQLKLDKEFGDYEKFTREVEQFAEARDEAIESEKPPEQQSTPLYTLMQTLAEQGHKPTSFSQGLIESDDEIINHDGGIELSPEPFDTTTIRFPEGSEAAISQIIACLEEHYPTGSALMEELNEFSAQPYHAHGNTLRIITENEELMDELDAIQEEMAIPLHRDWVARFSEEQATAPIR